MTDYTFRDAERDSAARWKQTTLDLPDAARAPASYLSDGRARGPARDFCLPTAYAAHNLLPDVRDDALRLFAELGIPWHDGIDGGPGNHLLSSQVQCANALQSLVSDPAAIIAAFGFVLDIAEVTEVEPGRFLTFEFIGPTDYFGEGHGGVRVRGTHCTSVDAAFAYRTSQGVEELALVEWKFAEEYDRRRRVEPAKHAVRLARYGDDFEHGPLRADLIAFKDMLDDPFYQLMRQQFLAARLEADPLVPAEVVRVVHVHPAANVAYQQSLKLAHRALGDSVDEVWAQLLRQPDRYVWLDPKVFLDPAVTSHSYSARYS